MLDLFPLSLVSFHALGQLRDELATRTNELAEATDRGKELAETIDTLHAEMEEKNEGLAEAARLVDDEETARQTAEKLNAFLEEELDKVRKSFLLWLRSCVCVCVCVCVAVVLRSCQRRLTPLFAPAHFS